MTLDTIDVAAPARLGTTRTSDGRLLGWAEWGPADGVPVLLCPGAATSRSLGFGTDVVGPLGVRLISLDRPGLGVSDPAPGRNLDDWAGDVASVVTTRALDRPAVVGHGQGAPFALACVAHGVASAAALVSAVDEVAPRTGTRSEPESMDEVAAELSRIAAVAMEDPAGAEQYYTGAGDTEAMLDTLIADGADVDREVYRQPAFAAALRRAMDEAFAQGPAGHAHDTVLTTGPLPFDLMDTRVPIDLWYGRDDPSHRPRPGEALAERLPSAHLHVVPGAGATVLWTEAERILRTLLGHRKA